MINIDDLTIKQARGLAAQFGPAAPCAAIPAHPYPVGEAVFIRTVTMHYTGRIDRVSAGELVLTDCAWIANSGRFHAALMTGALNEVEPFPDGEVIVPRDGIIDVSRWGHPLPRIAK